MTKRILIVEGDPPERALAAKRALGATEARAFAAALAEIEPDLTFVYAEPLFSDHDLSAVDFAAVDGVATVGSGVVIGATEAGARPVLALHERAFAASLPCFGTSWGMETAALALGGAVGPAAGGPAGPIARAVRPNGHSMTAGRRASFDVIALHREEVTALPTGAEITATSDDVSVQAFAYEQGGVDFRGVQYRPDWRLAAAAFHLGHMSVWPKGDAGALGREMKLIGEDPMIYARLAAKRRIGLDILDRAYHLTELRAWLAHIDTRRASR